MNKPIYLVSGSKGGVGKSIVAMAILDYFEQQGGQDSEQQNEQILLVESDTSNPDVWKCYEKQVKAALINLDEANGWIDLVNLCDQHKDKIIIINTAARNNAGVTSHGKILNNALGELNRRLITTWVINRQRDSLELMKEFIEAIPKAEIHVLRNNYFGDDDKFELYNGSNIRKTIESNGGKTLSFPDLADRVSDDLYIKRLSISKAVHELPMGNRVALNHWREQCGAVFAEIAP